MTEVFIYCATGPRHPGRRIPVATFRRTSGLLAGWAETTGRDGLGQSIVNDAPAVPGWGLDPNVSNADHRERYALTCPRCGAANGMTMRRERLTEVLDHLADAGVSEVSMSALGATLSR